MNFFTKKQNNVSEKLIQIGIDINSIKHEDLNPVEITLDDELAGKTRISYSENVNIWKFNTIYLTDFKDGKRALLLAQNYTDEREIRDIVNELYKLLGQYWLFMKELELYQMDMYRESTDEVSNIRRWDNFDDYSVELNGHITTSLLSLVFRGMQNENH